MAFDADPAEEYEAEMRKELASLRAEVEWLREALDMRPEVLAFAWLMERELRANDHKPGWKQDDAQLLALRMLEEGQELLRAVYKSSRHKIGEEAADVANMAMMVADVCDALDLDTARAALAEGQEGGDARR